MFVQSNFGIVTKMGMWLMPEPESLMGMDVEFDTPEDLKAMVDTIAPLRRERVLTQSPASATGCAPPRCSPRATNGPTSPARWATM